MYAQAAAGPEYEYPACLLYVKYLGKTEEARKLTHGAMIVRAPGIGNCFPSIEAGTCASHWSSSHESVDAREEYHEPAWLATLVVILRWF